MRQPFQNSLDNNLRKMFNVNRDYINQEIYRLASISARETGYRRNGMLDHGARKFENYLGNDYATSGSNMTSPIVGP